MAQWFCDRVMYGLRSGSVVSRRGPMTMAQFVAQEHAVDHEVAPHHVTT